MKLSSLPNKETGCLYLLPTTLGDSPLEAVFPPLLAPLSAQLTYYIVENVRTARRFLKKLNPEIVIDNVHFFQLDKHSPSEGIQAFLKPTQVGHHVGLLSEAGCPSVADPGALVVRQAHLWGIRVVPLVGPSSLLLALMASGLNGQSFAFLGYLPVKATERQQRLKQIEKRSQKEKQTQVFIETPYRNQSLFDSILKSCLPQTLLCIAIDLTLPGEYIATKSLSEWRQTPPPDLHKRPAVFLLQS